MGSTRMQPRKQGVADKTRLNPMQRMFVEALLADPKFNATAAAKKAGYRSPAAMGNKLVKNKVVQAWIGKAINERIREYKLDAKSVLQHLTTALFLDPLDLFEPAEKAGVYRVRSLDEVPQEIRRCISKIKCKTRTDKKGNVDTYVEIELMSKDAALPLALKHLGLIGPDGGPVTNINVEGNILIEQLLQQVEQERNVIDTKFIESKGEEA